MTKSKPTERRRCAIADCLGTFERPVGSGRKFHDAICTAIADEARRYHKRLNLRSEEECQLPDAIKTAGPLMGCPVCKRRDGDGHDDWCTPERRELAGTAEPAIHSPMVIRQGAPTVSAVDVLPVRSVVQSPADRATETSKAQRAAALPEVAKRRTAARLGAQSRTPEPAPTPEPKPIDPTPAPHPLEEPMAAQTQKAKPAKLCADCGKQPRYVVPKTGRTDPRCGDCRNRYGREWREANRNKAAQAKKAATANPESAKPGQRQPSECPSEATSARNSGGNDAGRENGHSAKNDGLAGAPIALPSHPAEMTLPELQAERVRVAAYLADLDERIDTAKALADLAMFPDEALRDMLATAVKQSRQIELALSLRGGAA